jgi:iron complex outermembrane receptor protein
LVNPPVPGPNGLPLIASIRGNENAETEGLNDVEAGYRFEIAANASIDVTGFYGEYDNLVTREPGTPSVSFTPPYPRILLPVEFDNKLDAQTKGLEVSGQWTPLPGWRLDGAYTAFRVTPKIDPTSRDANAAKDDGSTPESQWRLRSSMSLGTRGTLDVNLFRVGKLKVFNVPAYTRADVNVEWQLTSRLSAMVIGQNLFDKSHPEFANMLAPLRATEFPRSVAVRLRWNVR